ncbi:MAG: Gfo/Idh/MocA family oxidoreductase [Chloroflexi bacterium]|nr:Gfo/Idh/MocA family oxidoreductase [Chloroflexota bacterium]
METRYRAAVIATGRMSRAHGNAFKAIPNIDLVACADISAEAVNGFGEQYGIAPEHRYLDYRQMMDKERPDIVAIVSLHQMHAEMTIAAAEFKPKGIICEKPIAMNLAEADAMIKACKDAGTVLIVGHQRRYNAQYVAAYQSLKQGDIGDLVFIETHGHPGSSLPVDGTHSIDLARWYNDDAPVQWVMAQIDYREHHLGWGGEVENAASVLYGFANGVRAWHTCGSIKLLDDKHEALWPNVSGRNYHHIILRGTHGEIQIDGDAPNEGIPWVRLVRNGQVTELPLYLERQMTDPVHAQLTRDLLTTIETGAPHKLAAASARATLEVLMAAYESARRISAVALPLEVKTNPLYEMLNLKG